MSRWSHRFKLQRGRIRILKLSHCYSGNRWDCKTRGKQLYNYCLRRRPTLVWNKKKKENNIHLLVGTSLFLYTVPAQNQRSVSTTTISTSEAAYRRCRVPSICIYYKSGFLLTTTPAVNSAVTRPLFVVAVHVYARTFNRRTKFEKYLEL